MKTRIITTTFFAIAFIIFLLVARLINAQAVNANELTSITMQSQVATNMVNADFDLYQDGNVIYVMDQSSGKIQNRTWDMDDGGYKSDVVLFSHPYKIKGLHKVCLTVQGMVNSDSKCQKVIIK